MQSGLCFDNQFRTDLLAVVLVIGASLGKITPAAYARVKSMSNNFGVIVQLTSLSVYSGIANIYNFILFTNITIMCNCSFLKQL